MMPKYRMVRQEPGTRYTTTEVEAPTKDEADDMIWDDKGTVVNQVFESRDIHVVSFDEVKE